jgi:probable HAF family extracellular repeat protein
MARSVLHIIAYGINDFDQVAGASVTIGNESEHAFLWMKRSGMQDFRAARLLHPRTPRDEGRSHGGAEI